MILIMLFQKYVFRKNFTIYLQKNTKKKNDSCQPLQPKIRQPRIFLGLVGHVSSAWEKKIAPGHGRP